ncbi:hypothetical protein WBJ53_15885 [Spirosoma sp. SC4-14]|uniref:hypothetical protein n=1 Tax=Spirosoma sp. SC4-14 TaxID=3128900 RepID=UPI0030CF1028
MITSLRRRHYYTWLGLAISLPLVVGWAWLSIPTTPASSIPQSLPMAYPIPISSRQTDDLLVTLRKQSDGRKQLEIVVLKPLVGAANELFIARPHRILLGKLDGRGLYRFTLPDSLATPSGLTLQVYDSIKQQERETLTLP